MGKDETKFIQLMELLIGADEIDLMEGLVQLGDLLPRLQGWKPSHTLGQLCQQVGILLEQNAIDRSVTFEPGCFECVSYVTLDFIEGLLSRCFYDAVRNLEDLELSGRAKLKETIEELETQRRAFQRRRNRTGLFPWERGMEKMIDRWIVVCERRKDYPRQARLPRPRVLLRAPRLYTYEDRRDFAMYVELEAGTAVDDDFPILYGLEVRLEENASSVLPHGECVYELSRLDNVVVCVKIEPTMAKLEVAKSESGQLREELRDPPYRALTVILKRVASEDFRENAESVCGEGRVPVERPRLLILNSLCPVAECIAVSGQMLSVQAKLMTRTGPLATEKARLLLRVKDAP